MSAVRLPEIWHGAALIAADIDSQLDTVAEIAPDEAKGSRGTAPFLLVRLAGVGALHSLYQVSKTGRWPNTHLTHSVHLGIEIAGKEEFGALWKPYELRGNPDERYGRLETYGPIPAEELCHPMISAGELQVAAQALCLEFVRRHEAVQQLAG